MSGCGDCLSECTYQGTERHVPMCEQGTWAPRVFSDPLFSDDPLLAEVRMLYDRVCFLEQWKDRVERMLATMVRELTNED